jgi:hypothetical protein
MALGALLFLLSARRNLTGTETAQYAVAADQPSDHCAGHKTAPFIQ